MNARTKKVTIHGLVVVSATAVAMLGVLGASGRTVRSARIGVTDKVLLLGAHFEGGVWTGGPPRLLACKSRSKTGLVDQQSTNTDSLIKVLDAQGQEIYRIKMPNPRMILVEDPTSLPALKSSLNFDLRLPYDPRMALVQFYESGIQTTPSFVVSVLSPQPLPSTNCQFVNQAPTLRTALAN